MPSSVANLSLPGTITPDPVVVDSNIIVEYLLASFFIPAARAPGVTQFFQHLVINNGTGVVTPTAFTELVHIAVKLKYRHELAQMSPIARKSQYGNPVRNWIDLYKQDASILQAFLPDLHRLRSLLMANGLLFVALEDLGAMASGRSHDEELVNLVGSYGLDSSDAAILLEARQCGLTDIITLDADMQRASRDFNIYTWM